MRTVTPTERRRVLLALMKALDRDPSEDEVGSRCWHQDVFGLQTSLRKEHQIDLGYQFNDRGNWGTRDSELQLDTEILHARGEPSPRGLLSLEHAVKYEWWHVQGVPFADLEQTIATYTQSRIL